MRLLHTRQRAVPKVHRCVAKELVFFIPTHRTRKSRRYIGECVRRLRKVYGKSLLIYVIDDGSPLKLPSLDATVIRSEFPGAGEILAYYYYWKMRLPQRLVVIHDSCFVYGKLHLDRRRHFQTLWHASHKWDTRTKYRRLVVKLKNSGRLLQFAGKGRKWKVCFGVMASTTLGFLDKVEKKHGAMTILASSVKNRRERIRCERVMGLLAGLYGGEGASGLGNIFGYKKRRYGMGYGAYKRLRRHKRLEKVWTGR